MFMYRVCIVFLLWVCPTIQDKAPDLNDYFDKDSSSIL